MEAPWLSTVHNRLADIPNQCTIIRAHHECLSWPGAQGSAITAFDSLAAQRYVLQRRVLFLMLSESGGGNLSIYDNGMTNSGKNSGMLGK